ncbi:hypothetical protein Pve01_76490 [Planomonospora venezuelensis]|nr:hypothetical protein Pve01_76490 [Planomonospora venezuelensis]
MFFLTDLDPNAKVKGARDPLGSQAVWSGFGRRVVGNLTTQTTSLDDFRVLLIGTWLIDRSAGAGIPRANVFVAWEQLASYARFIIRNRGGFRGINQVQLRVQRSTKQHEAIGVGPSRTSQILTNQAAYGIWGLYTAAASRSGIIDWNATNLLSSTATSLVEDVYLPRLSEAWGTDARELLKWVSQGASLKHWTVDHARKLTAIASAIDDRLTTRERQFLRDTIVYGGEDLTGTASGRVRLRQRELAPLLSKTASGPVTTRGDVVRIAGRACDDLSDALEAILACESILAPAARVFSFICDHHGTHVDKVVAQLRDHFREVTLVTGTEVHRLRQAKAETPELLTAPGEETTQRAGRWMQIADALQAKDFDVLTRLLIEQNTMVSRDRGGSLGWVNINEKQKVQVRLKAGDLGLGDPSHDRWRWLNSYFLDNLLAMTRAVEA